MIINIDKLEDKRDRVFVNDRGFTVSSISIDVRLDGTCLARLVVDACDNDYWVSWKPLMSTRRVRILCDNLWFTGKAVRYLDSKTKAGTIELLIPRLIVSTYGTYKEQQ